MPAGTPKFVDFIALIVLAAIGAVIVNALGHRLEKAPSIAVLRLLPSDATPDRDIKSVQVDRLAFVSAGQAFILGHADDVTLPEAGGLPQVAGPCVPCRIDDRTVDAPSVSAPLAEVSRSEDSQPSGPLALEAEQVVARSVDAPHRDALAIAAAVQEPATTTAPAIPMAPPVANKYDVVVSTEEAGVSAELRNETPTAQLPVALIAPPQTLPTSYPASAPKAAAVKKPPAPATGGLLPNLVVGTKTCVWNFQGYPVVECS